MSELDTQNSVMSLGHKFAQARDAKKLSQDEVAQALNLTLPQLQKLESESLVLQEMTAFERGYVRNYAQFLGVDIAVYESEFPEGQGVGSELKSMSRFQYPAPKPMIRAGAGKWLLLIIALLVFSGLASMFM